MKKPVFVLACIVTFTAHAQSQYNDWQKMNLRGKVRHIKEFTYDEVVENGSPGKGKLKTITHYYFNQDGRLLEELVTNPDSIMLYKSVYTYDSNKLLLGKDIFFKNGPSTIQHRYKFSPDRKLIEENEFRSLSLAFTTQYEYNKKGELVQKNILNWVDPDQSFKETFKYDDQGRLIEKYTDLVSVDYRREFYTYDDNGIVTIMGYAKKKAPADVNISYKYDWDPNHNWTTVTEESSDKDWKDKRYRERTYEYF